MQQRSIWWLARNSLWHSPQTMPLSLNMNTKPMQLVVFRHAEKASWTHDPDLSPWGHQQASEILRKVQNKVLPTPDGLLVSSKKRTHQTFAPLQQTLNVHLLQEPSLDERRDIETGAQFEKRVRSFLTEKILTYPYPCLYLCTHMDWIEVFGWVAPVAEDLSSQTLHLAPGTYFHLATHMVTHLTPQLATQLPTPPQPPFPHLWSLIQKGNIP